MLKKKCGGGKGKGKGKLFSSILALSLMCAPVFAEGTQKVDVEKSYLTATTVSTTDGNVTSQEVVVKNSFLVLVIVKATKNIPAPVGE